MTRTATGRRKAKRMLDATDHPLDLAENSDDIPANELSMDQHLKT